MVTSVEEVQRLVVVFMVCRRLSVHTRVEICKLRIDWANLDTDDFVAASVEYSNVDPGVLRVFKKSSHFTTLLCGRCCVADMLLHDCPLGGGVPKCN